MKNIFLGTLLGFALLCPSARADAPVLNGDQVYPNIGAVKIQVRQYVTQGSYQSELVQVAGAARRYLELNLPRYQGQKPALVLDIDETSVSNWEQISRSDFGYVEDEWEAWMAKASAPALPATMELYRYARSKGVAVFFITAREEQERAVTERLLQQAGYTDYQELVLKQNGDQSSSAIYKSGARRRITEKGYSIVVNMGDQETDLEGGYADGAFKLPNPMYLVP